MPNPTFECPKHGTVHYCRGDKVNGCPHCRLEAERGEQGKPKGGRRGQGRKSEDPAPATVADAGGREGAEDLAALGNEGITDADAD